MLSMTLVTCLARNLSSPIDGTLDACRSMVHHQSLEAVLEGLHVGVLVALKFEGIWYDLHRPVAQGRQLAVLEAQVEVPSILRIEAESVHRSLGIGFGVCGEPLTWMLLA